MEGTKVLVTVSHNNSGRQENTEIEKRYFVNYLPEKLQQYRKNELLYGCFKLERGGFFRIRRTDDVGSGSKYTICFKDGIELERKEKKFPISKEYFEALWAELDPSEQREKTRYFVPHNGKFWHLNIYHGKKEGQMNAEIELDSIDEKIDKPNWVGLEMLPNSVLEAHRAIGNSQFSEVRKLMRSTKENSLESKI